MLKMLSTHQLKTLAARYVWWLPPEETLRQPASRLLLQVMRYATWEDTQAALQHFGADSFKEALKSAPPALWILVHGIFGICIWAWPMRRMMFHPMPARKVEDAP